MLVCLIYMWKIYINNVIGLNLNGQIKCKSQKFNETCDAQPEIPKMAYN